MSNREVWVIECSDRRKNEWHPLTGELFTDEQAGQRNLRAFAEPWRELWQYRLVKYVPESP